LLHPWKGALTAFFQLVVERRGALFVDAWSEDAIEFREEDDLGVDNMM
jgi:hypothetical protein